MSQCLPSNVERDKGVFPYESSRRLRLFTMSDLTKRLSCDFLVAGHVWVARPPPMNRYLWKLPENEVHTLLHLGQDGLILGTFGYVTCIISTTILLALAVDRAFCSLCYHFLVGLYTSVLLSIHSTRSPCGHHVKACVLQLSPNPVTLFHLE